MGSRESSLLDVSVSSSARNTPATGAAGPVNANVNLSTVALLTEACLFSILLLSRKENLRSPDRPTNASPSVSDPRELPTSGSCSTCHPPMMYASMWSVTTRTRSRNTRNSSPPGTRNKKQPALRPTRREGCPHPREVNPSHPLLNYIVHIEK